MIKLEQEKLRERIKELDSACEERDQVIDRLYSQQTTVIKEHETNIEMAKERIEIIKFNIEKTHKELKEVKQEHKVERRNYDVWLIKDRERLVHSAQYLRQKQIIHDSYVKEIARFKEKMAIERGENERKSQVSVRENESRLSKDKKKTKSVSVRRAKASRQPSFSKLY